MRSIMWKQLRARARAIAMLRARVNITTGREGTRFVTSTSEADREQQVESRSRTLTESSTQREEPETGFPAQGPGAPLVRGPYMH